MCKYKMCINLNYTNNLGSWGTEAHEEFANHPSSFAGDIHRKCADSKSRQMPVSVGYTSFPIS